MFRTPSTELALYLGDGDGEWNYADAIVDTGAAGNFHGRDMATFMRDSSPGTGTVTDAGGHIKQMGPQGTVHTVFISPSGDKFTTPPPT